MWVRAAALLLLVITSAGSRAAELVPGWSGRAAWESNVFRVSNDEESDFSVLTGPELRVRDRTKALQYDVEYRLLYEEFLRLDGLGAFQHFLRGGGTWRPTARDTLALTTDFARTESLLQLLEVGATGLVGEQLRREREAVTRNVGEFGYRRELSPLWNLELSLGNTSYWFESPLRSDSTATAASLDLTRTLSPRQSAGIGVSLTRQDLDETAVSNGSGTTFVQAYGIWSLLVQPTLLFSASVGPRWAHPDALEDQGRAASLPIRRIAGGTALVVSPVGCSPFAPGIVRFTPSCLTASAVPVDATTVGITDVDFLEDREDPSDSLGIFGRIALEKQWGALTTSLSYERSSSAASGLAVSTDLDVVSLRSDWRPTRRWRVVGIASWERQVSTSKIPINELLLSTTPTTVYVDANGAVVSDPALAVAVIPNAGQTVGLRTTELVDNAIDISALRLELRVQRDLTTRITVAGLATWWWQDTKGELEAGQPIQDARVELSITWRLAPIDL